MSRATSVAGTAAAAVALLIGLIVLAGATPLGGTVSSADWNAYRDRFIEADGRVVDDANGDISHSEGQGYGLLLAFSADDRATFERIWTFTRNELLIRDDGLAAWKWDPQATPHVADINNASDGDILIAYALGLAGKAWEEPRYTDAAGNLATAIGTNLLSKANGRVVLIPGVAGFGPDRRSDGAQVVNPSYWVFEAFPVLGELAPAFPWKELASSGLELIAGARFGPDHLPPDWVAITPKGLEPAKGFPSVFGYNAIRIPLYLLRAGATDGPLLQPFEQDVRSRGPAVIDLDSGRAIEPLDDPGYRMLDAAVACVAGTPIPDDLKQFKPTSYYPSTLYLLALSYVNQRQPQCL